ncbi:MAG: hypothetical protein ABSA46_15565 [Thermodesulfovibrionales bacterium]|jgi:D-arabinose 1-dehydrogenase-like Zn-dependent alcohol dehydrogenase
MTDTYKAIEITEPDTFCVAEKPILKPEAGQVRIRVEACGVCYSDDVTLQSLLPGIIYMIRACPGTR